MDTEKKRILEMVRDGKLTVDEAHSIIEAMDQGGDAVRPAATSRPARFVRVRVMENEGTKVNVSLPVSMVRVLWRLIPKDALHELEEQNVDLDSILEAIDQGAQGKLVDVEDEDGTTVEISLE